MKTSIAVWGSILSVALAFSGTTLASEMENVPPIRQPLVQKECGECHMAFQPALLPASAWQKMMDQLDQHFGDNATLPPEKADLIRRYLVENAGRAKGNPTSLRITETRWFQKEHHFSPALWSRPDVVTKSNCPACHKQADAGYYEDD